MPTTRRRGRGYASAVPGDTDSPGEDTGVGVCAGSFPPRKNDDAAATAKSCQDGRRACAEPRGRARTRKSPWAGPRGSRSWARRSRGVLSRRCAVGQGTGRPQPSRKPSDSCPLPPAPPSPSLRPCGAAWSSGNYSIPSVLRMAQVRRNRARTAP